MVAPERSVGCLEGTRWACSERRPTSRVIGNVVSGSRGMVRSLGFCCGLTDIESAPLTGNVELSRNHSSQPGGALMKRSSKYVGLDVHQATTVSTVRDDAGRVLART